MKAKLLKAAGGALVPLDDDNAAILAKIKAGSVVSCCVSEMRNGKFFRKYWALLKIAYDLSSERMRPRVHKGQEVLPSFESFREDVIILAGYYTVTYKYDGTLRLKAKSLAWSKMDEAEFEKLYSATIDAILQKILPGMDPVNLQRAVDATLSFT